MYLKKSISNGKTYLSFVQGYRDKDGKIKQKTIKKLGYLEELKKEYKDPIKYFSEIAKQTKENDYNELAIQNLKRKKIENNSKPKNLGYCILKLIYKDLGITNILKEQQTNNNIKYNLDDILSMLIYMNIIQPSSIKEVYKNKDILFEDYKFTLNDIYKSLITINNLQEKIEKIILENTKNKYKRDLSCCYYLITNYHFGRNYNEQNIFEYDSNGNIIIDKNGNIKTPQKKSRIEEDGNKYDSTSFVKMGLLVDNSSIPISYDILPNNMRSSSFSPYITKKIKKLLSTKRIILIENRIYNKFDYIIDLPQTDAKEYIKKTGYIYSISVNDADDEFKKWVLSGKYKNDIVVSADGRQKSIFKHKSRIVPQKVNITKGSDKICESIVIPEKQLVFYSQKYAEIQKRERDLIIAKAKDLIKNPNKFTKNTAYDVIGYINNLKFMKNTGKISKRNKLSLDKERIQEEELYDGYYAIVTSEENVSDIEIRNMYKGLGRIEDFFKITDENIEESPIWVTKRDHIQSHFLINSISLITIFLLRKKLNDKYFSKRIMYSLKNYTSTHLENNIYMQNYKDEVIEDIEKNFNIDLSRKYLSISDINKIINK